jgi:hypothetical protein
LARYEAAANCATLIPEAIGPGLDMKPFVYGLAALAAFASPVRAASCAEGVQVIEQISNALGLSGAELSKVRASIAKAKAEDRQGRERNCKIAAAGAIRFLLVRTLVD